MSLAERSIDYLRSLSLYQLARFVAFLLAPATVLAATVAGLPRSGLAVELERPLALIELKSTLLNGKAEIKQGVALILEPTEVEFNLPLHQSIPGELWTSLEHNALIINQSKINISTGGIFGKMPLIGVREPVLVVAPGSLGGDLQIPGGSQGIASWKLASRRSVSLAAGVLIACVFGFGASMTLSASPIAETEVEEERSG